MRGKGEKVDPESSGISLKEIKALTQSYAERPLAGRTTGLRRVKSGIWVESSVTIKAMFFTTEARSKAEKT
jgi:hypothetical protein